MFEKLIQGWQKATNPFQGFLGELWLIWKRDAGRAVLVARASWQSIPESIIQQVAGLQRQAQAAQAQRQIDEQVGAQLGALGIFSGLGGNASFGSFGPAVSPDQGMFLIIMGTIRAHQGDPPSTAEWVRLSEQVLSGSKDPVQALIESVPSYAQAQIMVAARALSALGMGSFFRVLGVVQAASALPRERIPFFLPDPNRS